MRTLSPLLLFCVQTVAVLRFPRFGAICDRVLRVRSALFRAPLYALALSRFVIADLRHVAVLSRLFPRPRPVVACIAYYSVTRWAAARHRKRRRARVGCRPYCNTRFVKCVYSLFSAQAISIAIAVRLWSVSRYIAPCVGLW